MGWSQAEQQDSWIMSELLLGPTETVFSVASMNRRFSIVASIVLKTLAFLSMNIAGSTSSWMQRRINLSPMDLTSDLDCDSCCRKRTNSP